MVKDSLTGLPFAPLTDLPVSLRESILRNSAAADGGTATPVVYFAELVRKFYKLGKKRFEHEVALILTKDSLCIYKMNGFIERRIKLSDVSAVVVDPYRDDPLDHHSPGDDPATTPIKETISVGGVGIVVPSQQDFGFEFVFDPQQRAAKAAEELRQEELRRALDTPSASQPNETPRTEHDPTATEGLTTTADGMTPRLLGGGETPRSAQPSPRQMTGSVAGVSGWTVEHLQATASYAELQTNLLVRAMLVLSRKSSPTSAEIQVANRNHQLPGDAFYDRGHDGQSDTDSAHLSMTAGSTLDATSCPGAHLFNLLNLQSADDVIAAGGKGARSAPVVAPTIETLSEEAQKSRMMADPKLEVEEMVAELLNQFGKYKREAWKDRNATYLAKIESIAFERSKVEAHREKSLKLQQQLEHIQGFNDRREKRLTREEVEARTALLDRTTGLTKQHDDHHNKVNYMKDQIEKMEKHIKELGQQQHAQAKSYISDSYEADQDFEEMKDKLRVEEQTLESCRDLPTIDELAEESASLQEATTRISEQFQELMTVKEEQEKSREEQRNLKSDNADLENEVLEHKGTLREAKERTGQLTTKVTSLFAKRNRIAKDAEWRERTAIPNLMLEMKKLEEILEHEMRQNAVLVEKSHLKEIEATVCEDHKRETVIHNSISKSLAELAIATEKLAVEEETALEGKMVELSNSVPVTARSQSVLSGGLAAGGAAGGLPEGTPRSALSSARRGGAGDVSARSTGSAGGVGGTGGRSISFRQPLESPSMGRSSSSIAADNNNKKGTTTSSYTDPYSSASGSIPFPDLDFDPYYSSSSRGPSAATTSGMGYQPYQAPPLSSAPNTGRHHGVTSSSISTVNPAVEKPQEYISPGRRGEGYPANNGAPPTARTASAISSVHGTEEEKWVEDALAGSPLSARWHGVA